MDSLLTSKTYISASTLVKKGYKTQIITKIVIFRPPSSNSVFWAAPSHFLADFDEKGVIMIRATFCFKLAGGVQFSLKHDPFITSAMYSPPLSKGGLVIWLFLEMGPLWTTGEVWKWGLQGRTSSYPFLCQCHPPVRNGQTWYFGQADNCIYRCIIILRIALPSSLHSSRSKSGMHAVYFVCSDGVPSGSRHIWAIQSGIIYHDMIIRVVTKLVGASWQQPALSLINRHSREF